MAPKSTRQLVLLFYPFALGFCPTHGVSLGLGSLPQCTFHLVHFYDPELSESILAFNQHGQPWRTYNVSRPLAKPGPTFSTYLEKLEDRSLHLDESRFCNVHLLVQPSYETVVQLQAYPNSLTVQSWRSTFFIIVTRPHLLRSIPDLSLYAGYMFRVYKFVVEEGRPPASLWFCFTCPVESRNQLLPPSIDLDGVEANEMYTKGHQFHGSPVLVKSWRLQKPYLCPSEFYPLRVGPFIAQETLLRACGVYRQAVVFVVRRLNGSVEFPPEGAPDPQESTIIRISEPVRDHYTSPMNSSLLTNGDLLILVYCDYDKRTRNNAKWTKAYDGPSWALLAVTCAAAALISGVRVEGGVVRLRPRIFNVLRLLQKEGSVCTRLDLWILLVGCVFVGYYEIYITSVAVVPGPPVVYGTIRELLEMGYKIQEPRFPSSGNLSPEATYKSAFRRLGIIDLLNTSFVEVSVEEFYRFKLPPHRAMIDLGAGDRKSVV